MKPLNRAHYQAIAILKIAPFEAHAAGGWRFGTRRIDDSVVDRLVANGRAVIDGGTVLLIERGARR